MAKDMLGTVVRKLVTLPASVLGIVCDLLEKVADEEWVEALKRFLRKENPWPTLPTDLTSILNQQINKLVEAGVHESLGLDEDAYRAELQQAVEVFNWSETLFQIGLNEVVLVDPRLKGKVLADKAGITYYINPDDCSNYTGVTTPGMPYVRQCQPGPKYPNLAPRQVRENFPENERGMTVVEALHWALCQDDLKASLLECYLDLPGSVFPNGRVPYLHLYDDQPVLHAYFGGNPHPHSRSASVGSN